MNRLFYLLIGIVWGLVGFLIIINPTFYSSYLHQYVDFRGIEWLFGGGLVIFGILCILSSFRKKAIEFEKKAKDDKKVLMCPKCVKPIYKKDAPDLKCSICGNNLEELEGFYNRYPELKI